jgi:hypothetical protein
MEAVAHRAFGDAFNKIFAIAAEANPDGSTRDTVNLYMEIMQGETAFWSRRARSQTVSRLPALRLVVDNTRAK